MCNINYYHDGNSSNNDCSCCYNSSINITDTILCRRHIITSVIIISTVTTSAVFVVIITAIIISMPITAGRRSIFTDHQRATSEYRRLRPVSCGAIGRHDSSGELERRPEWVFAGYISLVFGVSRFRNSLSAIEMDSA
jgi:hypothetical protein